MTDDQRHEAMAVDEAALERDLAERVRAVAGRLLAARPGHVYRDALAIVERSLIAHVLQHVAGNQLQAARVLGLNRNTLRKRCRQLNLPLPRETQSAGGRTPSAARANGACITAGPRPAP